MPLAHFFATLPNEDLAWWFGGTSVVVVGAFIACFVFLKRTRLMEDMPTSRLRSAAQGYVEVEGVASLMEGPPILCPLTSTRCVWWKYSVEEKQSDGRNTKWVKVDSGCSDDSFLLDDGTGQCVVDPVGATVIPTERRRWYGNGPRPDMGYEMGKGFWRSLFGRYRYTEELIFSANRVYALGKYRTQAGGPDAFDEQVELRELLDKWKHDKQMMALLDRNKDGVVDVKEWEAARRMAIQKVRDAEVERAVNTPDLNILANPKDGRPYILSGVPQAALIRRYRSYAAGCLGILAVASGLFLSALKARGYL